MAQMKMNKGVRSMAARKRKLEKVVTEENTNKSMPCAKPQGKQNLVQIKAKVQEKGLALYSRTPATCNLQNKPEAGKLVVDLPLSFPLYLPSLIPVCSLVWGDI